MELDFCTKSMHNWLSYFLWLKDILTRVIAREVNLEDTPCSKVMTRNPVFVLTETLAVEALQKMVQGWSYMPQCSSLLHAICYLPVTLCCCAFWRQGWFMFCREIQTFTGSGEWRSGCYPWHSQVFIRCHCSYGKGSWERKGNCSSCWRYRQTLGSICLWFVD